MAKTRSDLGSEVVDGCGQIFIEFLLIFVVVAVGFVGYIGFGLIGGGTLTIMTMADH